MEKKITVSRILMAVLSLICAVSMFLPWITIGDKGVGVDELLDMGMGGTAEELLEELELAAVMTGDASGKANVQTLTGEVRRLLATVKDGKLSVFEVAVASKSLSHLLDDTGDIEEEQAMLTALMWTFFLLTVTNVAVSGYNAVAALLDWRRHCILSMLLFLLTILVTGVLVLLLNMAIEDMLQNMFALGFVYSADLTVFHMSLLPPVGFAMQIAALVINILSGKKKQTA